MKRKNKKKVYIVLVIVIALLLIISVAAWYIMQNNNSSQYVFNGFTFTKSIANTWKFKFHYNGNDYDVALRVDPKTLLSRNYKLPPNYDVFLKLNSVNIFSDPELEVKYSFGMYDLGKVLASVFGIKVNYGVSRTYTDLPVYDCSEYGFYFTKNNESNRMYWLDKCLVINTTNADVSIEYADLLVYHYLGVMKNG